MHWPKLKNASPESPDDKFRVIIIFEFPKEFVESLGNAGCISMMQPVILFLLSMTFVWNGIAGFSDQLCHQPDTPAIPASEELHPQQ